jgi:hypothetical protein
MIKFNLILKKQFIYFLNFFDYYKLIIVKIQDFLINISRYLSLKIFIFLNE